MFFTPSESSSGMEASEARREDGVSGADDCEKFSKLRSGVCLAARPLPRRVEQAPEPCPQGTFAPDVDLGGGRAKPKKLKAPHVR